jgi:hypothetical protein
MVMLPANLLVVVRAPCVAIVAAAAPVAAIAALTSHIAVMTVAHTVMLIPALLIVHALVIRSAAIALMIVSLRHSGRAGDERERRGAH